MRRLPAVVFAALVVATVGAFFVTQHLKVSTPLIAGNPHPYPSAISPRSTACGGFHSHTRFSFYLLHRTDDVAVYVVAADGTIVRTLSSSRHMRRGVRIPDGQFPWDGREDNGRVAPSGNYYFRIALLGQGRTIELTKTPVQVMNTPPHPVVSAVSPVLIPERGTPVTIHYGGNEQRGGTVRIYRTDLPGAPRLVKSFLTPWRGQSAVWDGRIGGRPAPAGTYLIGLDVTDAACNTGHFPAQLPPARGTTPHAGVTVRYLAAQPPLDPVAAGSDASVYVDSRQRPYTWTLHRVGARRGTIRGAGRAYTVTVHLPASKAGLYVLGLHSGPFRTAVPIVAHATQPGSERILVVLPALTWQGLNAVDDDGDGIPNTLEAGGPISLNRPLAGGLPPGFADEAALLAYLDRAHLHYDLTTDLGLIDGVGPALKGHAGVVLAGAERWLPPSLGTELRAYVTGGGHLLSIGGDSMLRGVHVSGDQASNPSAPASADVLGARPGPPVAHSHDLITVLRDGLGIFTTTSGALTGFPAFSTIARVDGPGQELSAAGTSDSTQSIVGYRLGNGIVVDVGLDGFGASLHHDVDTQELIARLWKVLGGQGTASG